MSNSQCAGWFVYVHNNKLFSHVILWDIFIKITHL